MTSQNLHGLVSAPGDPGSAAHHCRAALRPGHVPREPRLFLLAVLGHAGAVVIDLVVTPGVLGQFSGLRIALVQRLRARPAHLILGALCPAMTRRDSRRVGKIAAASSPRGHGARTILPTRTGRVTRASPTLRARPANWHVTRGLDHASRIYPTCAGKCPNSVKPEF